MWSLRKVTTSFFVIALVCLYLSDLDEWDKPENRPINDDERDAIHGHATQALQLLGMKVEIE